MSGESSATPNQEHTAVPNVPPTAETVSKSDHQRALDDMIKYKKAASENEKVAADLKARLEALEKSKSESTGDFKTLYEQEKSARGELQGKYEGLKTSMVVTEKHKAASAALLKAGMSPEAMKILDREQFNEIEIEHTSQGRMITHGVDLYVDKFKKEYPFAFPAGKPPTLNNGGGTLPVTDTEEMTPARLFEIEQECKKTKNMKPYYEAVEKFKKSRMKN
jgi:hypothetical protein